MKPANWIVIGPSYSLLFLLVSLTFFFTNRKKLRVGGKSFVYHAAPYRTKLLLPDTGFRDEIAE